MKIILIADDLTGANVTGAAITRTGMHGITLLEPERCSQEHCRLFDAVLCSSDSRSLPGEEAYRRVGEIVDLLKPYQPALWVNRIDSTLRGNLGASTDAFLDRVHGGCMAIVVPAMVSGKREVRDGLLYLNGELLHETDVARDPKAPVFTSCVQELFEEQSRYSIRSVHLAEIREGSASLAKRIQQEHAQEVRILILDAADAADMETIAEAAQGSGIPFIAVDPGDFTAALAKRIQVRKKLFIIGSVNHVTKLQVEELLLHKDIHVSFLSVDKLCSENAVRETEIRRVFTEMAEASKAFRQCTVVLDSIRPENRIDFGERTALLGLDLEGVSLHVNTALASLARELLMAPLGFRQIFSCGGDITVAVCRQLQASGIEILHEVMPLIMHGRIVDGERPGLEVITKGGMVGNKDAILDCSAYLDRVQ